MNKKNEDKKYYLLSMQYKDEKTGKETTGNVRVINNKFVFEGNAEQSAKVFFDVTLKKLIDDYLKVRAEYTEKPYIEEMDRVCYATLNKYNAIEVILKMLNDLGYKKIVEKYRFYDD